MDRLLLILLVLSTIVLGLSSYLCLSKKETYKVELSNENLEKVCKQQCNLISTNPIFGEQANQPRCMENCLRDSNYLNVLPSAWV